MTRNKPHYSIAYYTNWEYRVHKGCENAPSGKLNRRAAATEFTIIDSKKNAN